MLLSREQQRFSDYQALVHHFCEVCFVGEHPSVQASQNIARLLGEAAGCFGLCELHLRQADRWRAADIMEESAHGFQQRGDHLNDVGLTTLSDVIRQLDDLEHELIASQLNTTSLDNGTEIGALMRSEVAHHAALLEIKPSDVTKIINGFDVVLTPFVKGDVVGVVRTLRETCGELDQMRRSADRGVIENIPKWKAALLITWLGIYLVVAFIMGLQPGHRRYSDQFATIMTLIGGLLALFC